MCGVRTLSHDSCVYKLSFLGNRVRESTSSPHSSLRSSIKEAYVRWDLSLSQSLLL